MNVRRILWIGLISAIGVQALYADTFENDRIEVYIGTHRDYENENFVLEQEIVRFIDESQKTLDVAVQELRSGAIANENPIKEAVLRAAQRGVKVRIMVESDYLKPDSDNLKTFNEFTHTTNIQIKSDDNPDIFHDKFIVRDCGDRDTAALLTGSTNFTDTGTHRNYNHLFIIHFEGDRKKYFEILDRYRDEFNEIWSGVFGNRQPEQTIETYRVGQTRITPLFAPDNDPDDVLLNVLLDANESLDVMMFTFGSNSTLLSGIVNRYYAIKYDGRRPTTEPKVKIRVGMEKDQCRYWSVYTTLKTLGVAVKVEKTPAKLHHKVGIVDNKTVIVGSYNWTRSANQDNDENTLVVRSSDIAALFSAAFNELWDEVLVVEN